MFIDFHYYGTYVAACIAGYTQEEAQTIAHAAQYVDDSMINHLFERKKNLIIEKGDYGIDFQPFPTCQSFIELMEIFFIGTCRLQLVTKDLFKEDPFTYINSIWAPFHFLPGNINLKKKYEGKRSHDGWFSDWSYNDGLAERAMKLLCLPDSPLVIEMINDIKNHEKDPYLLHLIGIRMHVLADTESHENFAGTPAWHVNDNTAEIIEYYDSDNSRWIVNLQIIKNIRDAEEPDLGIELVTPSFDPSYYGVSFLGHGRLGHIPDYPWIKYRYKPRWSKDFIEKDNSFHYLKIFRQMVYALKCIKGGFKTPITSLIEEPTKYDNIVLKILRTRHNFGLLDGGVEIRCGWWKDAIKNKYFGVDVPQIKDYDKYEWRNELDQSQMLDIKQTDYYKFNYAATKIHLNFVTSYLNNHGISLKWDKPSIKRLEVNYQLYSITIGSYGYPFVYFLGSDSNIYQIENLEESSCCTNLTASAIDGKQALDKYNSFAVTLCNNYPRIFFYGTSTTEGNAFDIWELKANNGPWTCENVTSKCDNKGLGPLSNCRISAITTKDDCRVYFQNGNDTIWELRNSKDKWFAKNLCKVAQVNMPAGIDMINAIKVGGSPHVYFSYYDDLKYGHICELVCQEENWIAKDLSKTIAIPSLQYETDFSVVSVGGENPHIYYTDDVQAHVWELAFQEGQWNATDVTLSAGVNKIFGIVAAIDVNIDGIYYPRVYGIDGNALHIWEFAWLGDKWRATDITTITKAPKAHWELSAVAVGGVYPHIYFIDIDGELWELAYENNQWFLDRVTSPVKGSEDFSPANVADEDLNRTVQQLIK